MRLLVLSDRLFFNRLLRVVKSLGIPVELSLVRNLSELKTIPIQVKKTSRLVSIFSTEIIPKELLNAFGYGCYNLHPGSHCYPGWRAWSFAIMNNEDHFGLTLHEMTPKVDEGLIIQEKRFPRDPQSTEQDFFKNVGYFVERFFNSFPAFFLSAALSPQVDLKWVGVKFRKRDVQELILINEEIKIELLIALIRAFGFGYQGEKPYVRRSGQKYILGPSSKLKAPANALLTLHGFSFWSEEFLDLQKKVSA